MGKGGLIMPGGGKPADMHAMVQNVACILRYRVHDTTRLAHSSNSFE